MNYNVLSVVKRFAILLFVFILPASSFAESECMLVPVPLNLKESNSSIIVEGKVISSTSYWNNEHNRIYTLSRVKVYKVFKGNNSLAEIEIYTPGGRVGLDLMTYSSLLALCEGREGIFFCRPFENKSREESDAVRVPVYEVYSSKQGFYEYNADDKSAHVPFHSYPDIVTSLYPEIENATGRAYHTVAENPIFQPQSQQPKNGGGHVINAVPTITNFSPATITAGTRSLLTINGTNFGATRGTGFVEFKNADDGGGSLVKAKLSDYRVWNNTQIQVWVPSSSLNGGSSAGTGTIKVTNSDPGPNNNVVSASTLTVTYSVINVEFNATGQYVENDNITGGGFQFHYESSTFATNAPAVAAFQRAFNSWICNTHINWKLGANLSTNVADNDGIFMIRFDVGSEIPNGVLGVTSSSFSGCINGAAPNDTVWTVEDIDVSYDGTAGNIGLSWQFGPAAPSGSQIDFESVCVHELGHTHTLDHIILNTAVMHYSISNGVLKRTLNATNDIAAGNFMMTKNTVAHGGCKPSPMISYTPTAAVTISANPGTSICSGTNVTFTASSFTAGDAPSYQWKKNGTNVGANSPTYTDNALINGNTISCVMTSSISCVLGNPATSNTLTMTVTSNVMANVSIIANPSGSICPGTNVAFTATPTNPGGAPVYQWKKNGTNVGINSTSYSNSVWNNGDQITCTMTSSITCVTNNPAISNTITETVVSIDDNNACTADACNTTTGTISHTNLPTNDGNACTSDGCSTLTGVFHNPVNTNDGNACTNDACNTSTGVVTHTNVNTNDGNGCTTDACNTSTGTITHNPVSVDDGNACTADACVSPAGTITHTNVPVDDGNACTADACNTSTGANTHTTIPVDDGNPCTIDGCNSSSGVFHNPAVEICGNGLDDDCDGFTDENCGVALNLKLYLEGFYTGGGLMDNGGLGGCLFVIGNPGSASNDVDTVFISAMNPSSPYAQVDMQKGILKTNGNVSVNFNNSVLAGSSYYLRVIHRNSIETWSKLPVLFSTTTSYDFTTSNTQAFDDGSTLPMRKVSTSPDRWAFFSGDIDQDGSVNSLDMTIEEVNSNNAYFGYYATDLTGNGSSDALDMTIIENNGNAGIFEAIP